MFCRIQSFEYKRCLNIICFVEFRVLNIKGVWLIICFAEFRVLNIKGDWLIICFEEFRVLNIKGLQHKAENDFFYS